MNQYRTNKVFLSDHEKDHVIQDIIVSTGLLEDLVTIIKGYIFGIESIHSTSKGFAALLYDRTVVTWGDPHYGGDSDNVQHLLKDVVSIHSTDYAFAAILGSGDVVTWGNLNFGGNDEIVRKRLEDIKTIHSTWSGFVAVSADNHIIRWGYPDIKEMPNIISGSDIGVSEVYATNVGFVINLNAGNIGIWGDTRFGFRYSPRFLYKELQNVKSVCSTDSMFIALLSDDRIVTWQHVSEVPEPFEIGHLNQNIGSVIKLCSTDNGFSILSDQGMVVTYFQHSDTVNDRILGYDLHNVQTLYPTKYGFAAKLTDHDVVTWQYLTHSVISPSINMSKRIRKIIHNDKIMYVIEGVKELYSTEQAFAALLEGQIVVTWNSIYPHNVTNFQHHEAMGNRMIDIQSTKHCFSMRLRDGNVLTWDIMK